jgi:hypothetical protein
MLHDHRLAKNLADLLGSLSWDSESCKNVAIVSYDLMFLKEVPAALYLFLQGPVIRLGIGELRVEHIITEASKDGTDCILAVSLILRMEGPINNEVSDDHYQLVDNVSTGHIRQDLW